VDRSGFWFRSVTFAIAFPFFVIALQFSVPRIHTAAEAIVAPHDVVREAHGNLVPPEQRAFGLSGVGDAGAEKSEPLDFRFFGSDVDSTVLRLRRR
jgi:hypothetical protein